MDRDAADALVRMVSEVTEMRLRFTALERAIEQENPALSAAFLRELESPGSQRAREWSLQFLDTLRKKLLDE